MEALQKPATTPAEADAQLDSLAQWALSERKNQVDPNKTIGGTWVGAIFHPIFETHTFHAGDHEGLYELADLLRESDRVPEPTDHVTTQMELAHGIGDDRPRDSDAAQAMMPQAHASAVVAAAIYARLGLEQPERNEDDRSPGGYLTDR